MKKELSKKEAELTDMFLIELIEHEKNFAVKGVIITFFDKYKISKENVDFILEKLCSRDLIRITKNQKSEILNIIFNKSDLTTFLNNGGMVEFWLKLNKLKNDFTLSKWKVKIFPFAFVISIIGGIYSIVKLIQLFFQE